MDALKKKLAAFQESRVGLFVKKVQDDQATNLGALLAWGTLSTMLPLLLGVLGIAGLVLRDPARLDQLYSTLIGLVPAGAAGALGEALDSVRKGSAGTAGIFGLGLLLFNGSRFFSNMAGVFNKAYHVEGRNFIVSQLVSILMLVTFSTLLVVSTLAFGLGSLLGSLPIALPMGPVLGRVLSWSLSIVSAVLLFVLLYRVLPNVKQGWRNVLPGALFSTVIFFAITALFPLYLSVFPPNEAYATFGLFLVFTFWLYLLGLVFVLGAELNSFLLQPARAAAIAEATANAEKGKVAMDQRGGQVAASAVGDAPSLQGTDDRPPTADPSETEPGDQSGRRAPTQPSAGHAAPAYGASATSAPSSRHERPEPRARGDSGRMGFGGRIVGLLGVVVAAVMLRGESRREPAASQRPAAR